VIAYKLAVERELHNFSASADLIGSGGIRHEKFIK